MFKQYTALYLDLPTHVINALNNLNFVVSSNDTTLYITNRNIRRIRTRKLI